MATWLAWLRGLFGKARKVTDPQRIAEDYRELTAAERKRFGAPRSAILKSIKRPSAKTPRISIRKFQEASLGGVKIETRAEQYRTGARPKLTPQAQAARPRRIGGYKHAYEHIPWDDVPQYFDRVQGREAQFIVLGETTQRYGGTGEEWRTISVTTNGDLEGAYNQVNSERGFAGFSIYNQPSQATIIVWPRKHFVRKRKRSRK